MNYYYPKIKKYNSFYYTYTYIRGHKMANKYACIFCNLHYETKNELNSHKYICFEISMIKEAIIESTSKNNELEAMIEGQCEIIQEQQKDIENQQDVILSQEEDIQKQYAEIMALLLRNDDE